MATRSVDDIGRESHSVKDMRRRERRGRAVRTVLAAALLAVAVLGVIQVVARQEGPDIAARKERLGPPMPPLTPRVTSEIPFKGAGVFDLDAGHSGVWVAAHDGRESFGTRLLRVDPLR